MSGVSNIGFYLSYTLYVISKCPIPMLFQKTTNWSLGLNIRSALILDVSSRPYRKRHYNHTKYATFTIQQALL